MITVLYIDDEPSHRDIGKRYLEKDQDFTVDTTASAREAMALPEFPQYDAIVSDYQMPAMDGIEFLKWIRRSGSNVPFILFTGKGREDVIIQALNERADFYFQKGGEPNSLFAEMREDIRAAVRRRKDESGNTCNNSVPPVNATTKGGIPGTDKTAPGIQEITSNPAPDKSGSGAESQRKGPEVSREGDEKFRAYIENSPEGIFVIDHTGKYIDVNPSACTMTGYSRDELLTLTISGLAPKESQSGLPGRLRGLRETGRISQEIQLLRKDGTIITVMLNGVRLPDTTAIAFCSDMTARKQAEEALRVSEEKYRTLADAAEDIIYIIDPEDRVAYINRYGLDLLKMNSGEVLGKPRRDLFREPVATRQYQNIRQVFSTGIPLSIESRIPLPERETWQDTKLVPLRDENGTITAVMGLSRDITESKKGQDALRESEEKYRILVDRVNEGIFIYQGEHFIFANTKVSEITGYSTEEIVSMPFINLIHPDDREMIRNITRKRKNGEEVPDRYDCRILRKDGLVRNLDLSVSTIHLNGAQAALGCARDVTESRLALAELRFKNVILTTQMETSPDAILIVDEKGTIVNYNRKFIQMWRIPEDVIVSGFDEPVLQFILRQLAEPAAFLARVRQLYQSREEKSFEEIRLNDGRVLERFSFPMLGDEGKYYGRVWYFRDITDSRRAEGALRIANKKLTLLTGITRHDIRNQTLSLNAYLDLSKQCLRDPAVMGDYISREEQIVKTIERQILFTREYEKLGVSAPVWQNIRNSVLRVTSEMDLTGVELDADDLQDVEIFADALLRNVLINLVDNSLRHGGHRLKTIRFSSQVSVTGLTIVCEDDGTGIVPEDKDYIFERGFGKNTGFGLFFIREILDITGISIRETGQTGEGARFEIIVPKDAFRFRLDLP